jgi:hypothetical protein
VPKRSSFLLVVLLGEPAVADLGREDCRKLAFHCWLHWQLRRYDRQILGPEKIHGESAVGQ